MSVAGGVIHCLNRITDMNKQANADQQQKKPFEVPVVRREARMPVVTAGSFDLIIPNA